MYFSNCSTNPFLLTNKLRYPFQKHIPPYVFFQLFHKPFPTDKQSPISLPKKTYPHKYFSNYSTNPSLLTNNLRYSFQKTLTPHKYFSNCSTNPFLMTNNLRYSFQKTLTPHKYFSNY